MSVSAVRTTELAWSLRTIHNRTTTLRSGLGRLPSVTFRGARKGRHILLSGQRQPAVISAEAVMGLMDKVRAQSTQLAQMAQETAREGKVKLDQAQAKRRADAMFRDLGATVYAERTGRGTADSKGKIDRLVDALSR